MILPDLISISRPFRIFDCLFPFLLISVTGRRMRTVINIYIGNLALADCVISVFCIPFQFQAALLQKWNLPFFMCKLCPFVQVRYTGISSHLEAKLRDWAVRQAGAGCYS